MLEKLFGRPATSPARDSRQVNEALSHLVLESPAVIRAALVDVAGLFVAGFPQQAVEQERISAMSAAMLSLGERICKELGSGDMRFAVVGSLKLNETP
jgi:predicted regulator of Ras-like GTPase activity (Roadblock/LC7/MglB family)